VLMVGAGGIGCELLKTLALSGFQDIHIVSISLFLFFLNFCGEFLRDQFWLFFKPGSSFLGFEWTKYLLLVFIFVFWGYDMILFLSIGVPF